MRKSVEGKVSFFFSSLLSCACILSACSGDVPTPFNCEESDLNGLVAAVTDASGCSAMDGAISVAATGGEEPYKFELNDGGVQTEGEFTNLSAGIYSVTITDNNSCSITLSNVNVLAADLSVTADVKPDDMCLGGDGMVTIVVNSGSPPYQYRIQNGSFGDIAEFPGLNKGVHVFSVKDANDCEIQLNVTVPHGQTQVSWSDDVLPIVESKCATNECHDGVFRPDLREYEKAFFYAQQMKNLTQTGAMPFEGTISQDQIDLIACWVDDGAPNN